MKTSVAILGGDRVVILVSEMAEFRSEQLLFLRERERIDRLADGFEGAFKAGDDPRIEDYLRNYPEIRRRLLAELLAVELELRRARGEQPTPEEYCERFPRDGDVIAAQLTPAADLSSTSSWFLDRELEKDEPAPQRLGRYAIQRLLGRGGYGVVYLAHDTQLDRLVALKVARRARFQSADQVARFIDGARMAAKLSHPALVAVHDVQQQDGLPYIVQEYIEGQNLRDWSVAKKRSFGQIARVLVDIAEALGYAHQNGLTHCDLKLANVLIDTGGHPHVADFGLAVHESVQAMRNGGVFGTPAMMAPEQVRGESHRLDARTDIWGIGVMLYELLTGRRPFVGDSRNELYVEILSRVPEPPQQINPQVPHDLERICLKCLSKRPNERYRTTDDLREDLLAWLDTAPSTESPRRHIALTAAFWGILLAVLLAMFLAIQQYAEHRSQQNEIATIESTIDAVQVGTAATIPLLLEKLDSLPRRAVQIELQRRFAQASGQPKLSLAYACAHYGQAEIDTIVAGIIAHDTLASECSNIVTALKTATDDALPELRASAGAASSEQNWQAKTRLAVVAMYLGDLSIAAEMLRRQADPIQRTEFIEEFPKWCGDVQSLAAMLQATDDADLRSGICLGIGSVEIADSETRETWERVLALWYEKEADPGTHSAAGWALRQWGLKPPTIALTQRPPVEHGWWHTPLGLTMLRIPSGHVEGESNIIIVADDFWLSDREISIALFKQFVSQANFEARRENSKGATASGSVDDLHPVRNVSWVDAVIFCNWLSRQHGFQECYELDLTKDHGKGGYVIKIGHDGFRLPTEDEWEYACRAGSTTLYSFGNADDLLRKYAVVAHSHTEACGSMLCNAWGLFDMHGNVWEWCNDEWHSYRVNRGGSWSNAAGLCQSSYPNRFKSLDRFSFLGFRVAQGPLVSREIASNPEGEIRQANHTEAEL